jgi:hypothetical protein
MSEHERVDAIRKRVAKEYVFDEPGEVVVGWEDDIRWLLDQLASLKAENERKDRVLREHYWWTDEMIADTMNLSDEKFDALLKERE